MEFVMTLKLQGLRELTDAELDQVHGGKITPHFEQINGGGNIPQGEANGVEPVFTGNENPTGKEPHGHNK
jgi:hypothetical protein